MSKAKGKTPKQKTPRHWITRTAAPQFVDNFLSPRALARVLGISVRTIYSRRRKGTLFEHTVLHGTHYYHIDDIADYAGISRDEIFARLLK